MICVSSVTETKDIILDKLLSHGTPPDGGLVGLYPSLGLAALKPSGLFDGKGASGERRPRAYGVRPSLCDTPFVVLGESTLVPELGHSMVCTS